MLGGTRKRPRIAYRLGQQQLTRRFTLPIYMIWTLLDGKKALSKNINVIMVEALTDYFTKHKVKIVSLDEVDMGRGLPAEDRVERLKHLYPPGEKPPQQVPHEKGTWTYRGIRSQKELADD